MNVGASLGQMINLRPTWMLVRRLFPYMRRHQSDYVLMGLMTTVQIGLGLFLAWFVKRITQAAMEQDLHQVMELLWVGLATAFVNGLSVYFSNMTRARLAGQFALDMKAELYNHVVRLPMQRFERYSLGDLMSRLTHDIDDVAHAAVESLPNLFRLPCFALAALVYVARIDVRLTLLCLGILPFAVVPGIILSHWIRRNSRSVYDENGSIQSFVQDSLAGMSVVKSFHLEDAMIRRYHNRNTRLLNMTLLGARFSASMAGTMTVSGFALFLLAMSLGAMFIARGSLAVASLLAFITLISQAVSPIVGVVGHLGGLQRTSGALERVFAMSDEESELEPATQNQAAILSPRKLELRRVSFRYDGDRHAVADITACIPSGSLVAIVGPSGAGKTTLLKLVAGIYTMSSGTVCIGDLPQINTEAMLRHYSAYVPQDTFLFHDTVRANLLVGNPSASEQAMLMAASVAQIHEAIMQLPQGYDTDVGVLGATLSGGQRQRLAIARALLKDAPILLLDEATSALDEETERALLLNLKRWGSDRIVFMITHRLSTAREADHIFVMDGGRLIESGTHMALMAQRGTYARLWADTDTEPGSFFKKYESVHF